MKFFGAWKKDNELFIAMTLCALSYVKRARIAFFIGFQLTSYSYLKKKSFFLTSPHLRSVSDAMTELGKHLNEKQVAFVMRESLRGLKVSYFLSLIFFLFSSSALPLLARFLVHACSQYYSSRY